MMREDILHNFEKMELLLIADFLLFNIIFGKEDLNLDDRKTSILLNITWMLLKQDNPAYIKPNNKDENILKNELSDRQKKEILQSKNLKTDLKVFRENLVKHSVANPPNQIKIFTQPQIKRIVEYIHKAYIDKFNLYKYVFENKKQNEEIRIMVDISEPTPVPPLKNALYMGYDYQPIVSEDEHEKEFIASQSEHLQRLSTRKSNTPFGLGEFGSKEMSRMQSGAEAIQEVNEEQDFVAGVIQRRVDEAKRVFDGDVQKTDLQFEERLNRGTKKKKK